MSIAVRHNGTQDARLLCIECSHRPEGQEFTHLDGVDTFTTGKDRRMGVRLTFYCERGHDFMIEFTQDQGLTLISTESI